MPSKIEWCEETWNPVTGCTHVSEGCRNCYAERMSGRLAAMGLAKYQGITKNGQWSGVVKCHATALEIPLEWKRPRVIFVNSMSDTFHPDVPAEFVHKILDICERCPHHRFLFLTKRPERAREVLSDYVCDRRLPGVWPNVGLGASVEDQQSANERVPRLLGCPTILSFLSCEPLLDLVFLHESWFPRPGSRGIKWIIVGCESGPRRRPVQREWLARIIAYGEREKIPVFVKQWDFGDGVVKVPYCMDRQYLERPEWFFAKCG